MKKSKTLSTKQLKQAASNLWFNPNDPGPMKVILDSVGNNIDYYIMRAREELGSLSTLDKNFDSKILMALRLLLIARAKNGCVQGKEN